MFGINSLLDKWSFSRLRNRYSAFNVNQYGTMLPVNYQFLTSKPSWISLSCPEHFEIAARFNPVVKAAINLLATSASNGKKVAVDIKTGETIPWTEKDIAIQQAHKLLVQRPNPLQSAKEFDFQRIFYLKVFGNNYVYTNVPDSFNVDLLNIESIINLPSQFVEVKTTGKIYDQTELEGIIEKYSLNNVSPVRNFEPSSILHFNEVNISSELPTVMGISKLEALKYPITNTQKAFEAMNTILTSRGMQGIIQGKRKDGVGDVPLTPDEQKEINDKFKNDYGLLSGQNPFLLTPVPLEYIKTIMNSQELGIYEEFSNNAILINNEFGVPPELGKTYIQGATFENQRQSVRRLYQDTVIPMVEDHDSYWSYRMNTFEYGFEIKSTWDHVPALQEAFKEKAMALNLKERAAAGGYDRNLITVNEYRLKTEEDIIDGGDVYKSEWDKKHGKEED